MKETEAGSRDVCEEEKKHPGKVAPASRRMT